MSLRATWYRAVFDQNAFARPWDHDSERRKLISDLGRPDTPSDHTRMILQLACNSFYRRDRPSCKTAAIRYSYLWCSATTQKVGQHPQLANGKLSRYHNFATHPYNWVQWGFTVTNDDLAVAKPESERTHTNGTWTRFYNWVQSAFTVTNDDLAVANPKSECTQTHGIWTHVFGSREEPNRENTDNCQQEVLAESLVVAGVGCIFAGVGLILLAVAVGAAGGVWKCDGNGDGSPNHEKSSGKQASRDTNEPSGGEWRKWFGLE